MNLNDTWTITNTRHDAHSLGQHNSVFAISNGYLGLKGNLCEDRAGYSPVTLINGVYDELDMFSQIRASNEERRYLDARHFDSAGRSPAVANLPNPLAVRVFVADREISFTRGKISEFMQTLSLRDGVYSYGFNYEDDSGRITRLEMTRFASATDPHRVYMRYGVTPLNHAAPVRVLSGINASVFSNTTRERQFSVTALACEPAHTCVLQCQTPARKIEVRMAVRTTFGKETPATDIHAFIEHDAVFTAAEFKSSENVPIVVDRFIAIGCSEDARHGVATDIEREVADATPMSFPQALDLQSKAWAKRWASADVEIEGDDNAQRCLRFCLYHLLAVAPRHTDKLGVPVKLLSGEYYQGNQFYDTDVYILPYYTFTQPQIAKTCLNWRHVGLEPGREIARDLGLQGAKFAWQAGPNGEECLGKWWRFTHTNIHINGDVAYALMRYWLATGDDAFMRRQGIDLLVETARFYASRAQAGSTAGVFHLVDVAGPDEGHCESADNFYTNWLAKMNLRWAARMLEDMRDQDPAAHQAAVSRLQVKHEEPGQWVKVADGLALLFDSTTKIYEQYEGFYKLQPLAPELSRNRKTWFATVAPYQALNQPDVLMAMALFRDGFPREVLQANYDFYFDKSMNFSSMSFVINSMMATETGHLDQAYTDFIISAGGDLDEDLTGRKDTYAGLHGTAMGGAWMAAVLGFGGVRLDENGLAIRPQLPPQWKALRFPLMYRGAKLDVAVSKSEVTVSAVETTAPVSIEICGKHLTLNQSQSATLPCGTF